MIEKKELKAHYFLQKMQRKKMQTYKADNQKL
jgi:hypothetical protein